MTRSFPLTYPEPKIKVLNGVKRYSTVSISVHNVTFRWFTAAFRWLRLLTFGYRYLLLVTESQSLLTSAATRMDSCGSEKCMLTGLDFGGRSWISGGVNR
jgi:hypothetical protein